MPCPISLVHALPSGTGMCGFLESSDRLLRFKKSRPGSSRTDTRDNNVTLYANILRPTLVHTHACIVGRLARWEHAHLHFSLLGVNLSLHTSWTHYRGKSIPPSWYDSSPWPTSLRQHKQSWHRRTNRLLGTAATRSSCGKAQ
jgi:hypothetical protein